MFHYTYILLDPDTFEFYIGSRSSKMEPHIDPYKGSMINWKVDKSKLDKLVLKTFLTREDANLDEIERIIYHLKTEKNPYCKNVHIPGIGFCLQGKKLSEETKEKMSISAKLRKREPRSEETKEKIRLSNIGKNLGKKHSDETKRKIGEKTKGMKFHLSDEAKMKISKARKGVKLSDFHKQQIKNSQNKKNK